MVWQMITTQTLLFEANHLFGVLFQLNTNYSFTVCYHKSIDLVHFCWVLDDDFLYTKLVDGAFFDL